MARVLCRLLTLAAGTVHGPVSTVFSGEPGAMLSEEMDREAAEAFASIPGYEIAAEDGRTEKPATPLPAPGKRPRAGKPVSVP